MNDVMAKWIEDEDKLGEYLGSGCESRESACICFLCFSKGNIRSLRSESDEVSSGIIQWGRVGMTLIVELGWGINGLKNAGSGHHASISC